MVIVNKKDEAKILGTNFSQYKSLNRWVKQRCREDKKNNYNKICDELEEEAKRHSSKGLYKKVKELRKGFTAQTGSIKTDDGTTLTERDKIKNRWLDYTKNYQKDANINIEEIHLGREKEPPPLLNEVESALKKD